MQYEQYQGKIKKIAAVLSRIYAVRIAIIITLAAVTALAVSAVAAKGAVISQEACPAEVVYGETPAYKAAAFLGNVTFEYRRAGETEWQTEGPDFVGDYQVRAVSTSAFGTPRYGEAQSFKVIPRPITPVVTAAEAIYGETPTVSASLVSGDVLSCGVVYQSIETRVDETSGGIHSDGLDDYFYFVPREQIATVHVDPATVRVTDGEGKDRTACYTVAETPSARITLTPRPLTVTVGDADKVYDGVALSFNGYEISEGTLAQGDTLLAVFDDSITMAGTLLNTPSLQVIAADGRNVTLFYSIHTVSGTLTVEKRPLIVETGSATLPYNGFEQTHTQFAIDPATPLVAGQELTVDVAPSLRDCGTTSNILTFSVTSKMKENFTDSYSIFVNPGTLTVIPREITVYTESAELIYNGQPQSYPNATADLPEGESLMAVMNYAQLRDVGSVENTMTVLVNRGSTNVTDNYVITYEYGTLAIVPRPVAVYIADATKVYDGTPLTSNAVTVAEHLNSQFSLVEGHVLTLETDGSVVFGVGENRYVEGSVRVTAQTTEIYFPDVEMPTAPLSDTAVVETDEEEPADSTFVDVTANYDITVLPGTLTVTPRPVTVAALDASKVYDGTPLTEPACAAPDEATDPDDGLLAGHTLTASAVGSQTEVGESPNTVDPDSVRITDEAGADVSAYYAVTHLEGVLKVTPCQIRVTTATTTWTYDERPHSDGTMTVTEVLNGGKFAEGHTLVCATTPLPSITDVGEIENRMKAVVKEGDRLVSHNYEITYEYGTLTVIPRPITIRIPDAAWIYNGQPREVTDGYAVDASSPNPLAGSQWMIAAPSDEPPTYCDAGTYENNRPAIIQDSKYRDVTANYHITYVNGTVKVSPRPLRISLNGEKIYDDKPLAGDEIQVDYHGDYVICDGHEITVSPKKTITDVGTLTSRPDLTTLQILNGTEDVTANYTVTGTDGTFLVNPRPLGVKSFDAAKLYDGTPLTERDGCTTEDGMSVADGHVLRVNAYGSGVQVGTYPNSVNPAHVRVTNADGVDKTRNYTVVSVIEGTLTILDQPITIKVTTGSAEKLFDGAPLRCPEYEATGQENLPAGYSLQVDAFPSHVGPGVFGNEPRVGAISDKGDLVTDGFVNLEMDPGILNVFELTPDMEEEYHRLIVGLILPDRDGTFYLREHSYGDFNRRTWSESGLNRYGETLDGGYGYQYLTSTAMEKLGYTLSHAQLREMLLFMLPYYPNPDGTTPAVGSDTLNLDTQLPEYGVNYFYTDYENHLVTRYMALSEAQRATLLGDLADEELAYREFVYDHYLEVHPETRSFLQDIIREQGFALSDPELILKVASYIQSAAEYDADPYLAYQIETSEDAVIAFLRDFKKGLCRHYASAAAMMYRTLGIPARYAVGYMMQGGKAGTWNEIISSNGPDNMGHAWVEVYLDGLGWVAVEVTGGSSDNGTGGGGTGGKPEAPKPTLDLTPVFQTKIYDGSPLQAIPELEMTRDLQELMAKGYRYTVTVAGTQLEVGQSDSYILEFYLYDSRGRDVTESYNVVLHNGLLKVTQKPVRLFLYPQEKVYDGQTVTWTDEDYEILSLPKGYTLKMDIHISAYEAGVVSLSDLNRNPESMVTVQIFNSRGRDVTADFTPIFVEPEGMISMPVLQIRKRVLELTASSETAVYGQTQGPLTNPYVYISLGKLVEGHTLQAEAVGSQTTIGSSDNQVDSSTVTILDQNGNNVNKNYSITTVKGTLTLLED